MCWDAIAAISTALSAVVVLATGLIIFYQLREMKKGTVAQAFSTIATMLDDDKVRMARRTLMNVSKSDFTSWTQKEINDAEIACSRYDSVGIMVRHGMVDHKMVTKEWRNSIIRCWEHAQPMITAFRKDRGSDFWDDFQWLYGRAKEAKTS